MCFETVIKLHEGKIGSIIKDFDKVLDYLVKYTGDNVADVRSLAKKVLNLAIFCG